MASLKNQREFINLRHLRVFCEVARKGGISAAAETVRLSQPAVTQAIAKLETTLDMPLFVRSSTGMFLTDGGTIFERRANRALDLIRTGCSLALSKNGRTKNARLHPFDHLITSTQLRALLAVGEFGNYSLAARRIGISQPSLHRVARELEKTSGLDFYVKTAQGIELTEPAQFLAQYTRLALSELRQGFEELDASKGIDSARIVVGTLPLARSFILPKAISDLTRVRPGVSISVVDGPYNDLLHGLRHGEIDFIIGALRDPVPIEDVEQQELFRDRLGIYARSGHPLTQKASVTLADLARYPWIISREGTPTRSHFDQFFQRADMPLPGQLVESSSLVLLRGILRQSDRLTMISSHQVREEEALGQVRRIPIDLANTERPIGITTRTDWKPTQSQSLLIQLLHEASNSA
ncbi:LysR family transcriptional regulator [Roseibium salinum]|uniref:LysR family transcriptional regulator n=1 Tax=Roseibium salinum TaxID=1604349 RepID=A0ABT3QV77_9HYPH|nr:LysR family transcriptional regulator [Roseibium sp. DSM 29163]MCX2720800.1 LysR family transcriptional regulator [Roseibium sp. DSM 29163]